MSKCRYDLLEDCNNTDCFKCMLDKIRAEIDYDMREAPYMYDDEHLDELYSYQDGLEHALNIINKYKDKSD